MNFKKINIRNFIFQRLKIVHMNLRIALNKFGILLLLTNSQLQELIL